MQEQKMESITNWQATTGPILDGGPGKNLELLSLVIDGYSNITEATITKLTNLKVLVLENYEIKLTSRHLLALANNPTKMEKLQVNSNMIPLLKKK